MKLPTAGSNVICDTVLQQCPMNTNDSSENRNSLNAFIIVNLSFLFEVIYSECVLDQKSA